MSNQPAKDPWAKFYRERGQARPPMAKLGGGKPGRPRDALPPTRAKTEEAQRWQALAEKARAATERPVPGPAVPPVAREPLRLLLLVCGALAAVILVFEAARFLFSDAPSAARLEETVRPAAQAVLAQYNSAATPWRVESARAVAAWRESRQTLHYDVVVTLRLQATLFAPLGSNGAESYRQLQRSLADARVAARRHGLDVAVPALRETPELPELLDSTLKEGERLTVRVPFLARRGFWRWQVEAPDPARRRANRPVEGMALAAWGEANYLRFDTAEERKRMRARMQQAREFVLTTNRELLARGLPPANRPVGAEPRR